jgi:hypothetical protein
MNRNRIVLVFLLATISTTAIGQEFKIENFTVGFRCGVSGNTTTLLVDNMTDLIGKGDYSAIANLLNSKNTGELYLSIIVLERLIEKQLFYPDEKKKKLLNLIKSSEIQVVICAGCFRETYSMRYLFTKENLIGVDKWLNGVLPRN